jgi:hypothetical protein
VTATHEEILGIGLWRKKKRKLYCTMRKLVGLRIRLVIRMVIVTGRGLLYLNICRDAVI